MKSLWNPNRFLRSINPQHWGNPQPTRTWKNAFVRKVFNSTRPKRRKVHFTRIWLPRSAP